MVSGDDALMAAFEKAISQLSLVRPEAVCLTQEGIVSTTSGDFKKLRRMKRSDARGLSAYERMTKGATEACFYVFDVLSRAQAPTVFCLADWTTSDHLGTIPLQRVRGAVVGRFTLVAIEQTGLDAASLTAFDEVVKRLHRDALGIKGGLLFNRPYVWNGKAGLEWAYREMPQSIPRGDVEAWEPSFDAPF